MGRIGPFFLTYVRNAVKSRFSPLFLIISVLVKSRRFRPIPLMKNTHWGFVSDAFRPIQSGPKHYKVIRCASCDLGRSITQSKMPKMTFLDEKHIILSKICALRPILIRSKKTWNVSECVLRSILKNQSRGQRFQKLNDFRRLYSYLKIIELKKSAKSSIFGIF